MPAPQSTDRMRCEDRCAACGLHPIDHVIGVSLDGVVVAGVMSTPTHFVACSELRYQPLQVHRVLDARIDGELSTGSPPTLHVLPGGER